MTDDCPNCQHPQHLPGTECAARIEHSPNRWHLCLCLARPGAATACPPQMTCQGGTLGYADIWYLQRGHSLSGPDGAISPEVLTDGPVSVGFPSVPAPPAPADRTPDNLRDDLLRALDFNFCVGVLGYGSPEALLDAYDASRAAAPSAPASPAPLAARLPLVQGRCPACGTEGLFLGDGGYVTCSVRECPEPDAASTVLERQAAAAQPPADRDLRGRIAQALVRYDWNAGLSGRDTPSEHHYGEADAVLAALPAPADRAAVLREAADAIEGITFAPDPVRPTFVAACLAIHLRRMADEAQQATPSVADADDPTQLRWGLGDVLYGDDDTTTVLMSGPAGEPYWLELDPDRAAALRDSLTSPDEAQQAGEVR